MTTEQRRAVYVIIIAMGLYVLFILHINHGRSMTRGEIHKRIKGAGGWFSAPEACRAAFCDAMASRDYGDDPLTDAWVWFSFGWTTAKAHASVEAQQARAVL